MNDNRQIAIQAALVLAVCAGIAVAGDEKKSAPVPLRRAHAHNDYLHARPFYDAIEHGFCSVEVDIWLVDEKLLVAHDLKDVKSDRTLQSLYLDPLRDERKKNGGRVFRNGPPFHLLIDIKSDGEATYKVLNDILRQYPEFDFSSRRNQAVELPLHFTVSGNRPIATIMADKDRRVAIDGRLSDLNGPKTGPRFVMISDDWKKHFRWDGKGTFPSEEREKLKSIVTKARQSEQRVRFWNTPETRACWQELYDAGVDLINTDDLDGLRTFLLEKK